MQSHTLKSKTKRKKARQVGRGGTRGKTSGRGTKGQNARAGRKKRPELRDFIKRFPKLRGRGVSPFKSIQNKPVAVNVSTLETIFTAGDVVTKEVLLAKRVINAEKGRIPKVKILGTGEISKRLTIQGIETSGEAKKKIEAAGGEVK
ncbi:uL15 family ribosomal protein [Candidatus Parcubacteria bacterium]|nr:uL15 family ribosomal protein [Candidatus Parcubacteria bacterium]